jgi:hypothetical protein
MPSALDLFLLMNSEFEQTERRRRSGGRNSYAAIANLRPPKQQWPKHNLLKLLRL